MVVKAFEGVKIRAVHRDARRIGLAYDASGGFDEHLRGVKDGAASEHKPSGS